MDIDDKASKDTMSEELDPKGFSSTQAALGFCALGLLAGLIVTPFVGTQTQLVSTEITGAVDRTVTGSISTGEETRRYTIRQSVMQRDPSVPCIIYEDGTQEGGC